MRLVFRKERATIVFYFDPLYEEYWRKYFAKLGWVCAEKEAKVTG